MANKAIKDFTVATFMNQQDFLLFQRDNKYYSIEVTDLHAGMFRVRLTLTQAQIKLLNGTPITLLTAQGSGTYIDWVNGAAFLDHNGTTYATGTTLQIIHSGHSNIIASTSSSFITSAADRVESLVRTVASATNQVLYDNTALMVTANANATNNGGSIYIDCVLRLVKFGV